MCLMLSGEHGRPCSWLVGPPGWVTLRGSREGRLAIGYWLYMTAVDCTSTGHVSTPPLAESPEMMKG